MNSIIKFNKHVLDFQSSIIHEFVSRLKLVVPDDIHSIIDEQLNKDTEHIKLSMKNINNNNKNKNKIKKPSRHTAWKLFAAHKSKDFPDVTQAEKWSLCSEPWKELKKSGEDQYWQDLADKLNNEQSPIFPDDVQPEEPEEPEKSEEPVKKPKATKKAEPAAKKTRVVGTKKKQVVGTEQDDDTLAPEQYIQINMD